MAYIDIEEHLRQTPEADIKVFEFINRFVDNYQPDIDNNNPYEVIRKQFRAGYCYYFAVILKDAFQRGEICWAAPYSHIVWLDVNNVPYDIEGVHICEAADYIPLAYVNSLYPNFIKSYKHLTDKLAKEDIMTQDKLYDIIMSYRKDYNIEDFSNPFERYYNNSNTKNNKAETHLF